MSRHAVVDGVVVKTMLSSIANTEEDNKVRKTKVVNATLFMYCNYFLLATNEPAIAPINRDNIMNVFMYTQIV